VERWYPSKIVAAETTQANSFLENAGASTPMIGMLERLFWDTEKQLINIAEFGIWQGGTSAQFAKFLDNKGQLHLFDFADNVSSVKELLATAGYKNVHGWGCSYKHLDSYNWPLRLILEQQPDLKFDYVYLDGAHTWAVDALTFFLCDMVLNVGGFIEFDDYDWRLRGSSLDPTKVPVIGDQYTDSQIDDLQVKAIVDLIVRRKPNYREIRKDRLFQKRSV
jgi:Methyltransferase domain